MESGGLLIMQLHALRSYYIFFLNNASIRSWTFWSREKLIVNKRVPADVTLDEEGAQDHGEFLEDEGDEEGVVDVVGSDVEDIDEVYEVEKEEELVAC